MKVLHILKSAPDASTKKIIDLQKPGNQVTTIDLTKGGISYDSLVAEVFAHDRVICW
ncbi:MAG: hypothetical protein OEW15_05675 [Nitrospirota bacterium]|nr:hypothetical protein [Nitrospirota bacterium]